MMAVEEANQQLLPGCDDEELARRAEYGKTGVKALVDSGIQSVPPSFVRPLNQRHNASEVCTTEHIPVVDLEGVQGARRSQIVRQISQACQTWGFFQVVNHGVPTSLLEEMKNAVHRYNQEPIEEKMKHYTLRTDTAIRYAPSFNPLKDKVMEWKDTLTIRYAPNPPDFNALPSSCRETVVEYLAQTRILGTTLLTLISEALCLPADRLVNMECMRAQLMLMNYFPRCPQPELTLGLSGHSDPGAVTVLLQDQVGGLQVFMDGRWVAVHPLPGSLVINLGDQIQILSNGRFKSVEHRVVTNFQTSRVSIPVFFYPGNDCPVKFGPIEELLSERNPPLYKEIAYDEYMENFLGKSLDGKSCLELVELK
eukprot:Gb_26903 [translate_table: standard]